MFQNLLWVYEMAWMSVRFPGLKFCPSPPLVHADPVLDPGPGLLSEGEPQAPPFPAATTQHLSSSARATPGDLGEKPSGPKQPVLPEFPTKIFGDRKRAFSTHYFKYPWVEYSIERDAVFCFACRHFQSQSEEESFTVRGVSD